MNEQKELSIELACEKLCRQFANFSDQNDFESLGQLFTEDGIYARPSVPEVEIKGRQTIIDEFHKRPPLVIRHLVSNCVIDVKNTTLATGISYIQYLAAPKTDEPLPLLAGPMQIGNFSDVYVYTAQGWKIQKRLGRLALKTA